MSLEAFLKSIDSDPRNREVYRNFGLMLYYMRRFAMDKFPSAWNKFKEQMPKGLERYPFYKNRLKMGLKVMRAAVRSRRPSDKQLTKFIEKLPEELGLQRGIKK